MVRFDTPLPLCCRCWVRLKSPKSPDDWGSLRLSCKTIERPEGCWWSRVCFVGSAQVVLAALQQDQVLGRPLERLNRMVWSLNQPTLTTVVWFTPSSGCLSVLRDLMLRRVSISIASFLDAHDATNFEHDLTSKGIRRHKVFRKQPCETDQKFSRWLCKSGNRSYPVNTRKQSLAKWGQFTHNLYLPSGLSVADVFEHWERPRTRMHCNMPLKTYASVARLIVVESTGHVGLLKLKVNSWGVWNGWPCSYRYGSKPLYQDIWKAMISYVSRFRPKNNSSWWLISLLSTLVPDDFDGTPRWIHAYSVCWCHTFVSM